MYDETVLLEKKKNHDFQAGKEMAGKLNLHFSLKLFLDLITDEYGSLDEWFYDIDPGVYDYVIKCVGGITAEDSKHVEEYNSDELPLYQSRYFHINTSRKYEIIGSSQDVEDEWTVAIENAGLMNAHWEIRLKEAYNYYIMSK